MDRNENRVTLTLMGNYSEPFHSECRAFGRLQETGYADLAKACYGYVLLDEAHEKKLAAKFPLEFNGDCEAPGREDMRGRYLGERTGKPPPIRGILKELGAPGTDNKPPNLTVPTARRILHTIVKFHQLGIIYIDVRREQLIDDQFCDFSTSITIPHFLTTPGLNPHLRPEHKALMEHEAFLLTLGDYWSFDEMLYLATESPQQTSKLLQKVSAFPGGVHVSEGHDGRPRLRSLSRQQERVYAPVDPRKYDWSKECRETASVKAKTVTKVTKVTKRQQTPYKRQLTAWPERWYYDCSPQLSAELLNTRSLCTTVEWYKNGDFIYPIVSARWYRNGEFIFPHAGM